MSSVDHRGPVRVRPVPDREPPPLSRVTESLRMPAGPRPTGATAPREHVQPQLMLLPGGRGGGPLRPLPPRLDEFAPRPTSTADLPEPRGWSAQMALLVLQVVTGSRPPTQLARFASPPVYESMLRRRAGLARRGRRPVRPTRVRAVVLSEPRDGIVDAAVVLFDGERAQPVALRMSGLDGRWIVTELIIG